MRVLSIFRSSRDRTPSVMTTMANKRVEAPFMQEPAEWREKAALYSEKARATEDYDLREQFTELAVRYLEMAEKFEDRVVAAAVLNVE